MANSFVGTRSYMSPERLEVMLRIMGIIDAYSSDSFRQPVALISNITLIPPNTRSKNDITTSIYTSTFSQKYVHHYPYRPQYEILKQFWEQV